MPGLRLIVGFEVRDEDFFVRVTGSSTCPIEHPNAGLGPFCSECGHKFVEKGFRTDFTPGGKKLALQRKSESPVCTEWRTWMQDTSRLPGALVVGRCGDATVLGVLVGSYQSGKRMAWPVQRAADGAGEVEDIKAELLGTTLGRETSLMLIE